MLYLELFLTFFKIGLFTIGGGYAMLPLIQADVQAKGWMTAEELVNFIAVSESTPGPFAVNVSTYVGAELAGLPAPSAPRWGWCCPPSSSSCWWPGSTPPSAPAPSSAAPWADCVRR